MDQIHTFFYTGGRLTEPCVKWGGDLDDMIRILIRIMVFEGQGEMDEVTAEELLREAVAREGKSIKRKNFRVRYDGSMDVNEALRAEWISLDLI